MWPFIGLLLENKLAISKTKTIFQNIVRFVPRRYLPFNEAYSRPIFWSATRCSDVPRSVTSRWCVTVSNRPGDIRNMHEIQIKASKTNVKQNYANNSEADKTRHKRYRGSRRVVQALLLAGRARFITCGRIKDQALQPIARRFRPFGRLKNVQYGMANQRFPWLEHGLQKTGRFNFLALRSSP